MSNDGRVRSLNYRGTGESRELKQVKDNDGYYHIRLTCNGITKTFMVHRLVAEAFLPNPNNLPQVSHLDETRNNNCVDNLEWATAKDNCNMLKHKERVSKPFEVASKAQSHRKKKVLCLDNNTVYESVCEAARQLNLSSGGVSACCTNRIHQHHGYHFEFIT